MSIGDTMNQGPLLVYATPSSVADAVPAVARGVFLADPVTRLVYGQSNGAGGYVSLGVAVLGAGVDIAGSRTIINTGPAVLASVLIPGGFIPNTGLINVDARWITDTAAHSRTLECYLGGQLMAQAVLTTAGSVVIPVKYAIAMRGPGQQSCHPSGAGGYAASGAALKIGTLNMAVDQVLEIRGTVATYALTLEYFKVTAQAFA